MSKERLKTYKLGDLCQITSSKRIFSEEYVDSGIPFYRSKEIIEKALGEEITESLFISKERFHEIREKFGAPQKGDLLLSSVGNRSGIPYVVKDHDGEFYFKDGNLTWFRDFANNLSSLYLYYWINSLTSQDALNSIMIGSAQKALTIVGLSNLSIELPSMPTQRRIAAILSALDEKIELNRQTNATLEAIAQAIFREWFVDFRFPGATGEMRNSELGLIPTGWRAGKLGDDFNITMGQSPPGESYNEIGEGISFFQGRTDFNFRFPTKRVFTTKPKRYAKKFDTLVSVRAPVGDMNIAMENCCVGRGLSAVIHKKEYSSFTYYFLKELTAIFKGFEDNGTVFGSINKSEFEEMACILPNEKDIFAFENICRPIDDIIVNTENQTAALIEIRDGLLPKLISG